MLDPVSVVGQIPKGNTEKEKKQDSSVKAGAPTHPSTCGIFHSESAVMQVLREALGSDEHLLSLSWKTCMSRPSANFRSTIQNITSIIEARKRHIRLFSLRAKLSYYEWIGHVISTELQYDVWTDYSLSETQVDQLLEEIEKDGAVVGDLTADTAKTEEGKLLMRIRKCSTKIQKSANFYFEKLANRRQQGGSMAAEGRAMPAKSSSMDLRSKESASQALQYISGEGLNGVLESWIDCIVQVTEVSALEYMLRKLRGECNLLIVNSYVNDLNYIRSVLMTRPDPNSSAASFFSPVAKLATPDLLKENFPSQYRKLLELHEHQMSMAKADMAGLAVSSQWRRSQPY
eukprot:Gregarina_sp_Poly_1__7735@NODE_436_length_8449_cov_138_152470_g356_i0_p3_GENE_NODE_436_length_8449_cov_138_152470_g356_i0NODE_436_length_8449_cov_138_152470_g356_i0_p3_ORF_typecomplete_len345_score45_09_NODE_436_length_8449_cov_138_152470_g356_i041385172